MDREIDVGIVVGVASEEKGSSMISIKSHSWQGVLNKISLYSRFGMNGSMSTFCKIVDEKKTKILLINEYGFLSAIQLIKNQRLCCSRELQGIMKIHYY
jgi:hypothetical protein